LCKRNKERATIVKEKYENQKQAVKDREEEEAGDNVLKADSKKRLKFAEEKRCDLGKVYIRMILKFTETYSG
jgi:hypothetical protein